MKYIAIVLVGLILLMSCHQASSISKQRKREMFITAITDQSTAPYYVLIKVKNCKTGEVKDICTEAPFLCGAVCIETKCNVYKADTIVRDNKSMYFEFSKDSALLNVGFEKYNAKELNAYRNKIDFDSITNEIKLGKKTDQGFWDDNSNISSDKRQLMYAHILLKNGIMVRRGCVAGNYLIFDKNEDEENIKEIQKYLQLTPAKPQ